MFEKVLLPTDFSEYARKTMEYLQEIPGIKEAILLHVTGEIRSDGKAWIAGHDAPSPSDRAWKTLKDDSEFLEARGIPSRIKIESAEREDIAGTILAYAEKEEVSLIMMGARGKGIIGGFLLGSVSSQVLRNAKSHVLITQYGPIQKKGIIKRGGSSIERYSGPLFRRVLIPVDFSRVSTEVIEFARDIEGIEEIILLHVISRAESNRELETQMKDSYKRLQYLSSKIDLGDIPVKIHIRFGSPAEEICTMADEEGATMIMVSRFGETGEVENILIGDTVLAVAKSAKRPVFVRYPIMSPVVMARELQPSEFHLAEEIWTHYRQLRADLRTDRIFGVFVGDDLVCAARCRRYPEGLAVDGVYTLDEFRGRGYATKVMDALVASCGTQTLYMYSPQNLVEFYKLYGFMPGDQMDIPHSIREAVISTREERELENLQPMKREHGLLERV
jgi:nucleotide-binding universal stress UspA family protein/GNAT superfamily N-acetyltransferase